MQNAPRRTTWNLMVQNIQWTPSKKKKRKEKIYGIPLALSRKYIWAIMQLSGTVMPAKSDCEVMFCLQSYQGLIIDDMINTQIIYRFALAQVRCTR